MPVVKTLRVAPVKGLATVLLDRVHIDEHGVAEDRRIFLLDEHGQVVTLRSAPALITATPDLDLDAGVLTVTRDGASASSALADQADEVHAHLYGKDRVGRVLPGDVAQLLSAAAGRAIRVVVAGRTGVGWDEGPVSILGTASAQAMGEPGQDTARYRMLVELEGTSAFEEDTWVGRTLQLGDATVQVTQQLDRCAIITQSPTTGAKDWEGLHALAALRGADQLCLGVIADVVVPGEVRLGCLVELLAADR